MSEGLTLSTHPVSLIFLETQTTLEPTTETHSHLSNYSVSPVANINIENLQVLTTQSALLLVVKFSTRRRTVLPKQ